MFTKPSRRVSTDPRLSDNQRWGRRQAGFSFIELLVALGLLSFILVGVLAMNTAYIKFNSSNKYYANAVQLAENGVESFMRLPYSTLNGRAETLNFGQISGFPNYTRDVTVLNWDANTCTIRSRAAWRYSNGASNVGTAAHWPIEISVMRSSL